MTTTDTTFTKEISYDRATGDFRATLDGNYIGHFSSYHAAECALDQVAYDLIADGQCATAKALDADSDLDTIAADYACTDAHPCDRPNHNHSAIYCAVDVPATECNYCVDPAKWVVLSQGELDYVCAAHYAEEYDRNEGRISSWAAEPIDLPAAPIPATALLDEADAALAHCPGAFAPCGADAHPSYAPYCQRCALALQRVAVAAYVQRLAEDIGLSCSFCGEAHAAADCPLRRPLIVHGPRVCGNCGGAHAIQQCDELRAALFAADVFYAVAA